MKTIDKIITKENCRYGAPMGRGSYGEPPIHKKISDCAVPLTRGYDKGGAYWGSGDPLRVRYTKDLEYVEFYRVCANDCARPGGRVFLFKDKIVTRCIDTFGRGDIRTEWAGVTLKGEYQPID